jgi:hypothetical protein
MARTSRPIPILLTALVAFFSALAAVAVSNGQAHAHGEEAHDHGRHGAVVTPKQLALHDGMRKLWEDHVTWTRLAIISLTTGSPDTQATVGRLLKNQEDIGNAVKPFYGAAAGDQLTSQLKEHILIAADLIAAAQHGDQAGVAQNQVRWEANADQIAATLNSINPHFWKLATMKEELHKHLQLTTAEVLARLHGDWAADVQAYDTVHVHMLHLADLLSDGIIKQFPRRFR